MIKQLIVNSLAKNNIFIRKVMPRPSVIYASKHFNNKSIDVCEVGVQDGFNSDSMLKKLNVKELYLIDIELKQKVRERFRKYQLIESDSLKVNVSKKFDFIYLDGDHSYEQVKKELPLYWSMLKPSGILAGHDIDHEGVFKAVGEFALKNNLSIELRFPDWWIVK